MTDITTVASPATAQPAVPPILFTKDLPGPLSLNRLAAFGTLRKLDDSAGYWIEHSGTLYGRAKIVAEVAPFGTVVCSMTAAWVWLGGPDFPSTIDVISTSHFRSASVSRLQIVKEHRHHKYAGRARMFFESVQQEMDEPALEQCA